MLLCIAQPVMAQTVKGYALSGAAAKGLEAAFRAEYGQSQRPNDTGAAVHVFESAGIVRVWFERPAGRADAYLVDANTGNVQVLTAPTASANEVVLPGPDAKAIAVAYGAWRAASVALPFSRTEFTLNRFTVSEHASLDSQPGYFVTYTPATYIRDSGLHCGPYAIYLVDPNTWQISKEPPIC